MPIYEYECSKCGKQIEAIQKISERPLTKCSYCSGKLHRLVSQSSFRLKGSGWYATDYAKKTGNAASRPEKKGETEPKPAEKTTAGSTADKT